MITAMLLHPLYRNLSSLTLHLFEIYMKYFFYYYTSKYQELFNDKKKNAQSLVALYIKIQTNIRY